MNNLLLKRPFTVAVEGNIGAGKTTFLRQMATSLGDLVETMPEPVDKWRNCGGHNLLQLFYDDPKRHSLALQSYIQLTMTELHLKPTAKPIRIMERTMYSARYCFVENLRSSGLMEESEFAVIQAWNDFLTGQPKLDFGVDMIVYLRTTPEVAYERTTARQRPEETKVAKDYLADLHNHYEGWLLRQTHPVPAPVRIVEADKDRESLADTYASLAKDILAAAQGSR